MNAPSFIMERPVPHAGQQTAQLHKAKQDLERLCDALDRAVVGDSADTIRGNVLPIIEKIRKLAWSLQ